MGTTIPPPTENFGSSARYVVGNPAQPLDQYHLYNVAGKAGELTARINGIVQYSTTINTYGYYTAPVLGVWSSTYFAGDVAEVLIYSRVLNSDERDAVNTYLNAKYGLVTNAPAAPTNLTASAVSTTQISLRWDFGLGNDSTVFKIERKTGAGGTYSQIAALADTTSYLDTNLTASTIYYYRVKASNSAGDGLLQRSQRHHGCRWSGPAVEQYEALAQGGSRRDAAGHQQQRGVLA